MEQRAECIECIGQRCGRPERRRPVLRLVRNYSRETVEAAREALVRAESGQAIGSFSGQILPGGRCVLSVAGEARTNPNLARGFLQALDDELAAMV